MLEDINLVTKNLQMRGIKLSTAQSLLNHLVDLIEKAKANPNGPNVHKKLVGCKLNKIWIGADSQKLAAKHFHNKVIKIQDEKVHTLTTEETAAVEPLLADHVNALVEEASDEDDEDDGPASQAESQESFMESFNKRQKVEKQGANKGYVNCDFILGSAAEIERVWSTAELILRKARFRMTPILFEALIYLKYNSRYWNKHLVKQAIKEVKTESSMERMEKELEAMELAGDNDVE